jgi:MioC protein
MMAPSVTILVATMTGTADLVAQEVEAALSAQGFVPCARSMADVSVESLRDSTTLLVVSSTYGNGDVPDNAQALFVALRDERPDLSHILYGLIALGDTTYKATFCQGGLKFDALLSALGAKRIGEPMLHDASSGTLAEDVAHAWAMDWALLRLTPEIADRTPAPNARVDSVFTS